MRIRRGTSVAAIFGVSVVVGVIVGASVFYLLPRNPGGSSVITTQSTGVTTSSTSQSASSTSTVAGAGNIVLSLTPTNRILGPGFSQDFILSVLPSGQTSGTYSLAPFGLAQGLSANINPNSISFAGQSQTLVVTIRVGAQVAPGTYQVSISARGQAGSFNQSFSLQIVPHLVQIMAGRFAPSNITVAAGSQVIWISLDGIVGDMLLTHKVQFSNGMALSPTLAQYDSWSYTFTTPGQYGYIDATNSAMTGIVVVTP